MKRNIQDLTQWATYEERLLGEKEFQQAAKKLEYEYTLAKSLIAARKKKQLSQTELAVKMGTKQPVISRLESGAVKPSFSLLERIAQALGAELVVKLKM